MSARSILQSCVWMLACAVAIFMAAPAMAQRGAARVVDENTTITLNLNNVPIEHLVKFLSDTTGKPVIKQKDINNQVSVFSPSPVTRREALELIYDALQLEGIYVIEEEEKLQIVNQAAIKTLELQSIDDATEMETMPDSLRLARKIYHLKNITPADLRAHLEKIIPESAMTIESRTNTLILTDQMTKLKRYDRIIKALDTIATTDRVIEVFQLKNTDAIQLSILIGNILTNTSLYESTDAKSRGVQQGLSNLQALAQQTRTRGATATSVPIMIGDVTMVPDPRTNSIIVSCPAKQMQEIRKLIQDFDKEQELDVQIRLLPVKYIDARTLSATVLELFKDTNAGASKDVVRVVPTDIGNSLMVYSTQANFDIIKELVQQLDNEDASKQETRTFKVVNIEVKELSDQLTQLYASSSYGRQAPYSPSSARGGLTKFLPSPRANTLLVMAYPREFQFIEELIAALDVPPRQGAFEPRMYQVKNTDANELLKTLQSIFSGTPRSMTEYYWRSSIGDLNSLEALYGKVRFVVDSPTNTIIVIASNSRSYEIIDEMVKLLDRTDPQSSEVMIYELKYASAQEVADQLNNLLSDGAVVQPTPPTIPTPAAGSTSSYSTYLQTIKNNRVPLYPWQSVYAAQRSSSTTGLDRPINRMIGNVRIVPDMRSNKVLVTAQPAYLQPLRRILETLDNREPQVHIATRMVEITRGADRRIGLRWTPDPKTIDPADLENAVMGLGRLGFLDAAGNKNAGGFDVSSESNPALDIGGLSRTVSQTTEAGTALLGADVNLAVLLQLLVKNTKTKIISEPALTVNNNETANIFAGAEFPFRINAQTSSLGTQTFGIEYRKVGINLEITPHINQEGEIDMRVVLENSKIRNGELVDGQLVKDMREFHTQLSVRTGQTMVIGGILLHDEGKTTRKLPIIEYIPLVNLLFLKRDSDHTTRELLVFITPEILSLPEHEQELLERSLDKIRTIDSLEKDKMDFDLMNFDRMAPRAADPALTAPEAPEQVPTEPAEPAKPLIIQGGDPQNPPPPPDPSVLPGADSAP